MGSISAKPSTQFAVPSPTRACTSVLRNQFTCRDFSSPNSRCGKTSTKTGKYCRAIA